jgi:hypothetical protein
MNFLENIRSKSDRTKSLVAFSGALLISGIIFVVWLSVIFPDWRSEQSKEEAIAKKVNEPSPIETFSETFGTAASEIGDQIGQIKSSVNALSIVIASSSKNSSTTIKNLNESIATTTGQ